MDNEDNECVEVLKRLGLEGKHFEAKGVSRANSSLPTTLSESAIESASIDHGTLQPGFGAASVFIIRKLLGIFTSLLIPVSRVIVFRLFLRGRALADTKLEAMASME
jgi:hypothetical protein